MTITHIQNVRDLLVVVIGRTGGIHGAPLQYPDLSPDEAVVAHVLDAITLRSLKLMVTLRESQGWTDQQP